MPQACSKEPPWDQSSSSPRQTRIDGLVKRKAKAALQWQATGYIVGRPKGNDPTTGEGGYFPVSWSYFDAFNVPVLRGRNFTERDGGSAPGVVIINESMAKQYWPKGDPTTKA